MLRTSPTTSDFNCVTAKIDDRCSITRFVLTSHPLHDLARISDADRSGTTSIQYDGANNHVCAFHTGSSSCDAITVSVARTHSGPRLTDTDILKH